MYDPMLNAAQVAARLNVCRETAVTLMRRMPCIEIGIPCSRRKHMRILESKLDQWIEDQQKRFKRERRPSNEF